VYIPYRWCNG